MNPSIRWWAAVAAVAWMGVIFYFSAQSGITSGGHSRIVVDAVLNLFPAADAHSVGWAVRKAAHLGEYVVLGGLLALALRAETGRSRAVAAVALGVVYAASDEFHQVFVPGRAGTITDVGIDSVGVSLGVILAVSYARRRIRRLA